MRAKVEKQNKRRSEMKDENGIKICCKNCKYCEYCKDNFSPDVAGGGEGCSNFEPSAEAQEADRLRGEVKELEEKLTKTVKLLSERSRECGKLEAEVKVLKAFVTKVHTSPVIFEDVNRALRDEAKTLLEKLNQSAESKERGKRKKG